MHYIKTSLTIWVLTVLYHITLYTQQFKQGAYLKIINSINVGDTIMKKMLSLIYSAVFLISTILAQTSVTIQLDDSYGDGWDSAFLTVAGSDYTAEGATQSFTVNIDDGVYFWSYTGGDYPGENTWTVSTADGVLFSGNGETGPFSGQFSLGDEFTPIYDVQFSNENNGASPLVGQEVKVYGVVTAIMDAGANTTRIHLQDGNSPWSGVAVQYPAPLETVASSLSLYDVIDITGTVEEYQFETRIASNGQVFNYSYIAGNLYQSGSVDAYELENLGDVDESLEGMLVFAEGVVGDVGVGFDPWLTSGYFGLSDGVGSMTCHELVYSSNVQAGNNVEVVAVVGSYSPMGYDQDSYLIPSDPELINITEPCGEDDNSLTVEMEDSWGDSWNGNVLTIGDITLTGPELSLATEEICLADGAYPVTCGGGEYQSEVSWAIFDADGNELLSGGAPFTGSLVLGETDDVLGCTDETAINYNDQATVEDGSCYYDGDSCSVALDAASGVNSAESVLGESVWFTYTTTMSGTITITSQNDAGNAQWDTDLYVYSSCDALGSPIAENDDCCDYYGPSEVTMPITSGETYLIEWRGSYADGEGPFAFYVFETPPPTAPQNLTASPLVESVSLTWEGIPLTESSQARATSPIIRNFNVENSERSIKKAALLTESQPHSYSEVFIKGNRNTRNTDVTIVCDGGEWQSEISWEILNAAGDLVATGGAPSTANATLDDGLYTILGYDTYGDGWNGNSLTVTGDDGTQYANFTFTTGDFGTTSFWIGEQTEFPNLTLSNLYYDFNDDAVYVTVTNNGTFSAGSFYVVYYLLETTSNECENQDWDGYSPVEGLEVGESVEVGLGPGVLEYIGGYGTYEIGAMADVLCEVPESNEDDNTITETLNIEDPFGGVTWIVSRSDAGGDFVEVGVSQVQEYLDEGLTGNVEYCYTVQQVDADGATPSDTSNNACATPVAPINTPTPTALEGEVDGWSVSLSWTEPDVGGDAGEDFESGALPNDWTMTTNASCGDESGWFVSNDASGPYWSIPAGEGYYVVSNDDLCQTDYDAGVSDGSADYLYLPPVDMSTDASSLNFTSYFTGAYGQTATVLVSVDGGSSFEEVLAVSDNGSWTDVSVDLSAYLGESSVQVVFHSNDNDGWGSGWALDNISVGAPPDYILQNYNIYRGTQGNEELVGDALSESFYFFETEAGTFTYSVTATYEVFGESGPSNYIELEVSGAAPSCSPPQNLTAETSGNNVALSWDAPLGGAGWLAHTDGSFGGGIGYNAAADFSVAARFTPDVLFDYDGMSLTKIQFIPYANSGVLDATYTPQVWVAQPGQTPQLVYTHSIISPGDLVANEYNIIDLNEPIVIDWTAELWIGYNTVAPGGYPAGNDLGPYVNDGLWIYGTDGNWANLFDYGFDSNWAIQGYLEESGGQLMSSMPGVDQSTRPKKVLSLEGEVKRSPIQLPALTESNSSRALLNYRVYRDGNLIGEPAVDQTTFDDLGVDWGEHGYYVTAMYDNSEECGESEPSNSVTVNLFNNPPLGFSLVNPQNGFGVTVTPANVNQPLAFIWTPAADIDGDVVSYTLSAMSDDEVFYYDSTSIETGLFVSYSNLVDGAAEEGVSNIVYYWNVGAHDGSDTTMSNDGPRLLTLDVSGLLSVEESNTPNVFALHNNYPNPFNPVTNITYDIPEVTDVVLEIFNMSGQKVRTLINSQQEPGRYKIVWNATNDLGAQLASGMYIYRIKAGDFVSIKKLILMK